MAAASLLETVMQLSRAHRTRVTGVKITRQFSTKECDQRAQLTRDSRSADRRRERDAEGPLLFSKISNGVGLVLRTGAAPLVSSYRLTSGGEARVQEKIPAKRWGVALLGKAALDEAFFATEIATGPLVGRADLQRVSAEVADATRLFEQRGWLDKPAEYHRAPPRPRSVEIAKAGGRLNPHLHLKFSSGYEPRGGEPGRARWLSHEANRTAHAWLLEHDGKPRPWMVCIPGYRMGSPMIDFAGLRGRWLHETLGLNVAIPVLPMHGPRRIGRRGGDGFLTGDFLDTIHAQSQAVWDVRRLIAWLRHEKEAVKIGVHGISLGGCTTALLASLEKKLSCAIAGIPAADLTRLVRSNLPAFLLKAADRIGLAIEDVERLMRVVSPLSIPALVPQRRRYIYAGLADRLTTPDHAFDLWHHWKRPHAVWYQGSHVSFLWEKDVKQLLQRASQESGMISTGPAN